jgi:hypothetical protein
MDSDVEILRLIGRHGLMISDVGLTIRDMAGLPSHGADTRRGLQTRRTLESSVV